MVWKWRGCVGMLGCFVAATALAAPVGDPRSPADLPKALADAYRAGARDIQIAPGAYRLPASARDQIEFDRWEDATIDAHGVLIEFENHEHQPVIFNRCRNVTFSGATIRRVHAPDTQGEVIAIGVQGARNFCDWRVDAGYPTDFDIKRAGFNVVDRHAGALKVGPGDVGPNAVEAHDGLFRFWFGNELPRCAVGDVLVTRAAGEGVVCHVDHSTKVTLADLILENGGFGTIFETEGGGNRYLRCTIRPGPRPVGAVEDRLVGCGADGLHSVNTSVGPDIEDCRFEGVFLDDCIAVHGSFQQVVRASGNQVVLEKGGEQYQVGEPIRMSDSSGFFDEAKVRAIGKSDGREVTIEMDRPLSVAPGAKANNPDRCGKGFKILRCRLGNTRSRGILVKGDDGLIDQCLIDGCGMSAISVGPEYYWNEADYCWNVTISHNLIRGCDRVNDDHNTPVLVHGDGAIGNRNILIQQNAFVGNFGKFVIKLECVDGVKLIDNSFTDFPEPARGAALVWAEHARAIQFRGTMLINKVGGVPRLLETGNDVTKSQVAGEP